MKVPFILFSSMGLLTATPAANAETIEAEQNKQIKALPTIVITATETANQTTAATKFELDPLQTPQNVQVLGQDILQDNHAQRITDVTKLVSGVSALNPMAGLWDNYAIRGFNTDQTVGASALRNGVNAYLGMNAAHDMVNIDRLEFLKGPEAALYGAGDPGGTINIVTKKPQFSPEHRVDLSAGSYDQYRAAFDSTNAITDTVAYRLGVAYENKHSFRDFVKHDRLFVAPQLTWQPNDQTQIDYDSEYTQVNSRFDRGVLAVNQQLGKISNHRFLGEQADGLIDMDDYLQQLRLKHQWNDGWKSEVTLNYKHNTLQGFSTEAYKLINDQGDLNRERRYRDNTTTSYVLNHDLIGQFSTANLLHKVAITTELSHLNILNRLERYRKTSGADMDLINIYRPVYGVNLPDVNTTVLDTDEDQNNIAFGLSDYIEFNPQWALLLGGRVDYYQQKFNEYAKSKQGTQYFTHFSPKAALNYRVNDQWSVFVSAGKSFHLNSGLDENSELFQPEKALTYEIGTKNKFFNDRIESTISLFHIKKKNVLVDNPTGLSDYISTGEQLSRGVEVDLSAEPIDRLKLKLAYAYTDASVRKGEPAVGIERGDRLLNSPKHSANLFAMYDLWQSGQQKIGVGGNLNYVSDRSGNVKDDGFELPSYTLLNLNAYYQINEKLRSQFTLNNVFNKTYYSASLKDEWVTPGNPREAFLSVSYSF
ncbi:TonB-dependent siderophore receptor [Acinetobacter puyangensis]|uniref:TonB-dependent siderophore receptor n=1 Tax=Acinetobacter puyangensis TaxID=1096779 RepID=UPI003A4DB907